MAAAYAPGRRSGPCPVAPPVRSFGDTAGTETAARAASVAPSRTFPAWGKPAVNASGPTHALYAGRSRKLRAAKSRAERPKDRQSGGARPLCGK
jgi:hypothetical protein